jgi:nicotinamide-nucleotide amidase
VTLAADAVSALREASLTVATAESLTAGLLAARIASVPGASAVLRGGIVAYATDLKGSLLGVPSEVLREHGAVSQECAAAMAVGAASACGAEIALSLTGVAGPDRQEGHPPGTVCLGVAGPQGVTARTLLFTGDRAAVRAAAVDAALEALLALLG